MRPPEQNCVSIDAQLVTLLGALRTRSLLDRCPWLSDRALWRAGLRLLEVESN